MRIKEKYFLENTKKYLNGKKCNKFYYIFLKKDRENFIIETQSGKIDKYTITKIYFENKNEKIVLEKLKSLLQSKKDKGYVIKDKSHQDEKIDNLIIAKKSLERFKNIL